MATILRDDDFEVGMLICQHTGPTVERQHASMYGELQRWEQEDKSATGVPLELLAINLPFVVVLNIIHGGRVLLDAREMRFMRVSEEFARALHPEAFDRWQVSKHLPRTEPQAKSVATTGVTQDGRQIAFTDFMRAAQGMSMTEIIQQWREVCTCVHCVEYRRQRDCAGK